MGLGWELALDMIDYGPEGSAAQDTPARDTPSRDTPAGDTPAGDAPAADAPAADASVRGAAATFARARQQPRELRVSSGGGSREVRLLHDDVTEFFDVTALEVADELEVADGRFSIAIVVAGEGWAEGEFGREPLRHGQTFAWPAGLALRVRAAHEPVRIVRCLGPREAG
jgi:hypothetical protein